MHAMGFKPVSERHQHLRLLHAAKDAPDELTSMIALRHDTRILTESLREFPVLYATHNTLDDGTFADTLCDSVDVRIKGAGQVAANILFTMRAQISNRR